MKYTKVEVAVFLPTTSASRVNDAVQDMLTAAEKHKGERPFVIYSGPHSNGSVPAFSGVVEDTDNGKGQRDEGEGPGRELGRAADGAGDGRSPRNGDGSGEPAKRGRGRPRKDAGPGKAAEGPERGPEGDGADEGGRGNEPVGTRAGSRTGADEGEGRSGGADGGRGDQRGTREASRVTDADDWDARDASLEADAGEPDWDDAPNDDDNPEDWHAKTPGNDWPDRWTADEYSKADMNSLMGEHFKAAGGNSRAPTLDLMFEVTGERNSLGGVDPKDYRKLAKALLHDIARYKHGVKKPSK